MRNILGLDIGVASIGWALVEEADNGSKKIVQLGTRIIPLTGDDKNEFSKGNAISKNQKRTLRRTQRRGYDRYQLRRSLLKEKLLQAGMLPDDHLVKLSPIQLYGLRDKAVRGKIELKELGRVLLHLNQKRGYKSSRKSNSDQNKETEYVSAVNNRHIEIKERGLTVGQFFYLGLKEDSHYRVKEQVFPRIAYQEEFDQIMNEQRKYYPALLTEKKCNELRNEIIYYQRPLKSQKKLVSICEFEGRFETVTIENKAREIFVGPKVAPRSSPLFQVCKIRENINNIKLKSKSGQELEITADQRLKLFEYLDNHELLTTAELFRILGIRKEDFYVNKQLEKGLQGNTTKAKIAFILNKVPNKSNLLRFDLSLDHQSGEVSEERISGTFENEPLYRLWHIIYSLPEKCDVVRALVKQFHLPESVSESLADLDFTKSGFGNKSAKAIRKILPFLEKGMKYSDACAEAGYNHSNSITKDENLSRVLSETLPNLPKNSLRQPIVEKILNQLINLVNAIIKEYGRPSEIRVELARELKQSKEERNKTFRNIEKRNRENLAIAENIESDYKLRSTRRNIEKWRLFHEMEGRCIYCNKGIELADFLRGEQSDIEHIIPRSRLFDDSMQNKTISHRKCNSDKGNLTAFDFMNQKGVEALNDYIEAISSLYRNQKIGRSKRDKFLLSTEKIPKDFIERQLRETQYISRKAREILSSVCYNVYSTSGSVTDYLRYVWGWDEVLMNLQIEKHRAAGQTEWRAVESNGHIQQKEYIKDWTKRSDHRHHAIDALTIACTSQSIIQRLNNLNQIIQFPTGGTKRDGLLAEESLKSFIEKLRPFSASEVAKAAERIFISIKKGKKVVSRSKRIVSKNGKKIIVQRDIAVPRGPLSEEHIYGKIKRMVKRAPVKAGFDEPELIVKERIKKLVLDRIQKCEGNKTKAYLSLKKDPIYLDDEKKEILEFITVFKEEYVIKYPVTSIKTEKDIESVVDEGIKAILKQRVSRYDNNLKEAFKNIEEDPVYLDKSKTIKINTVRTFRGLSNVKAIGVEDKTNQLKYEKYVKPGNNHHIAIYKDNSGKLIEHVVSFWDAVERSSNHLPVIIEQPEELWMNIEANETEFKEEMVKSLPIHNWKFIQSLQQNEYFILGLSDEELNDALRNNDEKIVSEHLYRVQKISPSDYTFRYHLETEIKDNAYARDMKAFYRFKSLKSFLDSNPVKATISITGRLSIGDRNAFTGKSQMP